MRPLELFERAHFICSKSFFFLYTFLIILPYPYLAGH